MFFMLSISDEQRVEENITVLTVTVKYCNPTFLCLYIANTECRIFIFIAKKVLITLVKNTRDYHGLKAPDMVWPDIFV